MSTCIICGFRAIGRPLCSTNHCDDFGCVKACPFCMDELRDEDYS